jgi:serine/threonine-protein kinase
LSAVAEHVTGCDTCCAALGLVKDDTLVGLARAAGAATPVGSTPLPPLLPNTNIARPLSDANVAPSGEFSVPAVPAALADHPQYRILGELGEGGMGVVYKAEHRLMGRVVALKVMAPRLTAKDAAVDRFRREVKAAGRLAHPNIVVSHDAGEAGGLHFLVMEYVDGISLDRFVARRGPLPVAMACQFARQIALGLQHAFEKGMVHRDIKPHNVMLTRKGQIKILDFGLARFARDQQPDVPDGPADPRAGAPSVVTAANQVMGTPDYLSPEQARSSHAVDIRSDLYSLGCTLYFLLTGQVPFPAATTLIDKLLAHTEEQPVAAQSLRLDVPDALAAVLAKLLAKRPGDRYATPAEVAAALAPFARGDAAPQPAAADPGFEIVDAVVVAPPPAPVIRPAVASEPPAPPTEVIARGKRSRPAPRRKKAGKRGWPAGVKLAVAAGVAVAGLVVGVVVRQALKAPAKVPDPETAAVKDAAPPPYTPDNTKLPPKATTPPAPAPVTPPDTTPIPPPDTTPATPPVAPVPAGWPAGQAPAVLFVLPRYGLWPQDYFPVRKRLEEAGVKVVTAAPPEQPPGPPPVPPRPGMPPPPPPQGVSEPDKEAGPGWTTVRADLHLSPQLDTSGFAAVVFVGKNAGEFVGAGPGREVAGRVIQQAQKKDAVLAAICTGQGVLASHGVLTDKRVAANEQTRKYAPFGKLKIEWTDETVLADGNVVTAARPEDAVPFADALVEVLRKK